jgi:ureidoacrylate peracid hydrolase
MHRIAISMDLVERLTRERGGKLHRFDDLDPTRTALVVIDMQNGFMAPGAPVEVPIAREIVPNVNAIVRAVRKAGGTNVFLRFTTPGDTLIEWSNFYAGLTPDLRRNRQETFAPGNDYRELWSELEVAPQDLVVDKRRFGAFVPGTSELDAILRTRGIDTVIIAGTVTNICCETTAREAMQLNYRVIFVSDANAALSDDEHNTTLNTMCALFADVMDTGEVIAALEGVHDKVT